MQKFYMIYMFYTVKKKQFKDSSIPYKSHAEAQRAQREQEKN